MNAQKKKSALIKYTEIFKENSDTAAILDLLKEDEKGYSEDEIDEIMDALMEIEKPSAKEIDPANTPHDEYRIKLESDGKKFTGATVMKVVGVRKIHPSNAASLNIHAGNSLTCYFTAGKYKVSDVIDISVLREIAPGFNWGKAEEI